MIALPTSAQLKLYNLQTLASDISALAAATRQRVSHMEEALRHSENTDDDTANVEHELTRLRSLLAQQQHKTVVRAQTVAQVSTWQQALQRHWTIDVVKDAEPKLMPGETHLTAVQRLRMDITKLSAELRRVTLATMEVDDQKRRAASFVRNLAQSVNASVSAHHLTGFKIDISAAATAEPRPPALAFAAWLDPMSMTERLHEIIDRAPNGHAMSASARERRLNELSGKLLQAEREEEGHVVRAAENGTEIERRPQADPCALLGLKVTKKAQIYTR